MQFKPKKRSQFMMHIYHFNKIVAVQQYKDFIMG